MTTFDIALEGDFADIEIADAPTVEALSPLMQSIVRNYIGARARAGGAILDAARYLAEARAAAKYGEWGVFLESTGTQEDTASRMIAIATRADADPQYARAITDGRLAFTAAFELLSAPAETQQHALESDAPTRASTIRQAKQESKLRTSAEFAPAPITNPLPSEDEQHRATIEAILIEAEDKGERTGTRLCQQAYDHAAEIHDLALHNQMISLIDRATDAPAGDPLPAKTIALALADLDATLPQSLSDAGYFWRSAAPPTIEHNDGWRGDAPTVEQTLSLATDRERAKDVPLMITLPPFPAKDLPALMDAISRILRLFANKTGPTYESVAPALGLLKAIGRKALETTES